MLTLGIRPSRNLYRRRSCFCIWSKSVYYWPFGSECSYLEGMIGRLFQLHTCKILQDKFFCRSHYHSNRWECIGCKRFWSCKARRHRDTWCILLRLHLWKIPWLGTFEYKNPATSKSSLHNIGNLALYCTFRSCPCKCRMFNLLFWGSTWLDSYSSSFSCLVACKSFACIYCKLTPQSIDCSFLCTVGKFFPFLSYNILDQCNCHMSLWADKSFESRKCTLLWRCKYRNCLSIFHIFIDCLKGNILGGKCSGNFSYQAAWKSSICTYCK